MRTENTYKKKPKKKPTKKMCKLLHQPYPNFIYKLYS